eukprot:Rmarinus@m.12246
MRMRKAKKHLKTKKQRDNSPVGSSTLTSPLSDATMHSVGNHTVPSNTFKSPDSAGSILNLFPVVKGTANLESPAAIEKQRTVQASTGSPTDQAKTAACLSSGSHIVVNESTQISTGDDLDYVDGALNQLKLASSDMGVVTSHDTSHDGCYSVTSQEKSLIRDVSSFGKSVLESSQEKSALQHSTSKFPIVASNDCDSPKAHLSKSDGGIQIGATAVGAPCTSLETPTVSENHGIDESNRGTLGPWGAKGANARDVVGHGGAKLGTSLGFTAVTESQPGRASLEVSESRQGVIAPKLVTSGVGLVETGYERRETGDVQSELGLGIIGEARLSESEHLGHLGPGNLVFGTGGEGNSGEKRITLATLEGKGRQNSGRVTISGLGETEPKVTLSEPGTVLSDVDAPAAEAEPEVLQSGSSVPVVARSEEIVGQVVVLSGGPVAEVVAPAGESQRNVPQSTDTDHARDSDGSSPNVDDFLLRVNEAIATAVPAEGAIEDLQKIVDVAQGSFLIKPGMGLVCDACGRILRNREIRQHIVTKKHRARMRRWAVKTLLGNTKSRRDKKPEGIDKGFRTVISEEVAEATGLGGRNDYINTIASMRTFVQPTQKLLKEKEDRKKRRQYMLEKKMRRAPAARSPQDSSGRHGGEPNRSDDEGVRPCPRGGGSHCYNPAASEVGVGAGVGGMGSDTVGSRSGDTMRPGGGLSPSREGFDPSPLCHSSEGLGAPSTTEDHSQDEGCLVDDDGHPEGLLDMKTCGAGVSSADVENLRQMMADLCENAAAVYTASREDRDERLRCMRACERSVNELLKVVLM